jgi:hypothetical protein
MKLYTKAANKEISVAMNHSRFHKGGTISILIAAYYSPQMPGCEVALTLKV